MFWELKKLKKKILCVCMYYILCVYILSPTILQRTESHVPFFSQFSSAAPSSTCSVLATSSQPIWLSTSKHPSSSQNSSAGGFPGGPVVKNPSANAGHTGLIPGLGRSHMSQGNSARVSQLMSLCSRALVQQRRPSTAKNQ